MRRERGRAGRESQGLKVGHCGQWPHSTAPLTAAQAPANMRCDPFLCACLLLGTHGHGAAARQRGHGAGRLQARGAQSSGAHGQGHLDSREVIKLARLRSRLEQTAGGDAHRCQRSHRSHKLVSCCLPQSSRACRIDLIDNHCVYVIVPAMHVAQQRMWRLRMLSLACSRRWLQPVGCPWLRPNRVMMLCQHLQVHHLIVNVVLIGK